MELVINISEEDYEKNKNASCDYYTLRMAIKNGIPLPKGHGRLIDADALPQEDKDIAVKSILKPGTIACVGAITLQEYMNSLPTIIEAESEK